VKKALALLVIVVAARTAGGEPYRPLPRLPPAKVKDRAASPSNRIPVPAAASAGAEPAPGDTPASPTPDARPNTASGVEVARPALRRARRTGPPPPLQDEVGRTVMFAAANPLQDDGGGFVDELGPVQVIVLPSPGKRASDTVARPRDRKRAPASQADPGAASRP
jgi:hypothetical protein